MQSYARALRMFHTLMNIKHYANLWLCKPMQPAPSTVRAALTNACSRVLKSVSPVPSPSQAQANAHTQSCNFPSLCVQSLAHAHVHNCAGLTLWAAV